MSVTQSPSVYSYCFRGKTTGRYYFYAAQAIPAALLDMNGNILEISSAPITTPGIGSEYLVWCSQTGEMRRGTKGSPDPSHPYLPGYNASPWEHP